MSAKSNESTTILPKVQRIVHLKAFQTLKIGLTKMGTGIMQTTAKMTGSRKMNQICNWTTAVRIQKPLNSGM
jgi:hypothetical protein